jgi:hypothetical protein
MRSVADRLALDEYHFDALGRPAENPATKPEGTIAIRMAAAAQRQIELQKLLGGLGSFGMGGFAGFYAEASGVIEARVDFWPGLIRQDRIRQQVVLDDGETLDVELPPTAMFHSSIHAPSPRRGFTLSGETRPVPLGRIIHTRCGDKGANANLGVWTRRPESWEWLRATLTAPELTRLLHLQQGVQVERHELPNLHGMLFVLHGQFGVSGSGNAGLDPFGKAIGEFLSSRTIDVPVEFLRPPQ